MGPDYNKIQFIEAKEEIYELLTTKYQMFQMPEDMIFVDLKDVRKKSLENLYKAIEEVFIQDCYECF